jgi:hypothetical protein
MKKTFCSIFVIVVAGFFCIAQGICGPPNLPWATYKNLLSSPGPIGETSQDTIRYRTKSINKSANATALTAAECSNTLITNYGWNGTADGDQTFTLADAEEGLEFLFLNLVTHATADIYFDPADNTTQIVLNGTACGDDERVWTDNATAYESIHFYTFPVNATAYDWAADSVNGVWADKGS